MFTGLIQTTGTVLSINTAHSPMRLVVAAPALTGQWRLGDSIAVNGVCLTAVGMEEEEDPHPGRFAAELAEETVQRTTLSRLKPGSIVNLELPTMAGARLGGHVVQGHVDSTGKLLSLVPLNPDLDRTDWRLSVEVPSELARHVIPQGSITIDGISLTVAAFQDSRIEIAVIPHTYHSTNLHTLLSGAEVNIEADVLSKYAARSAGSNGNTATAALQNNWPVEDETNQSGQRKAASLTKAALGAQQEWLTAEYLLSNGY